MTEPLNALSVPKSAVAVLLNSAGTLFRGTETLLVIQDKALPPVVVPVLVPDGVNAITLPVALVTGEMVY